MVNWWFGIRIKRCLFHNKYHSKGDPRIQTTNLPLAETTKTEETYCSKHSITILHLLVFEGYTCFFHFTTPPPTKYMYTTPPLHLFSTQQFVCLDAFFPLHTPKKMMLKKNIPSFVNTKEKWFHDSCPLHPNQKASLKKK